MVNSDASKKLKKEVEEKPERPEWQFKVFHRPPGMLIDHFGDRYNFSKEELEEISVGARSIRFFDKDEKKWKERKESIDLARYPWLPKGMYRTFMMNVCDALGIVYRPYMLERIMPEVLPKARIEFRQKLEWEKQLERTEDLKVKYKIINEEIKVIDEFYKMVKKK